MRVRLVLIAAFALLGMTLVAGCGDDDSSSGASAAESTADAGEGGIVSKQEFIDQANSLCAARSAELKVKGRDVFKEVYSKPEAVAAKQMVDQVIVPVFEGELSDLKTLNIPAGDGQEIAGVYAAIEEMVKKIKADPKAGNFYPYTEAEKLAAAYGITACGHP